MYKLLDDPQLREYLNLDYESLESAVRIIIKVAKQDPATLVSVLCLVGAIENNRTDALALVCTVREMRELIVKQKAAKEENTIDEESDLSN